MEDTRFIRRVVAGLLAVSVALYTTRYLVFGQGDEMLRYLMDDLAFLPVSALIVGLVLNRLLEMRERESLMHKLNMVIGAFFSEVGNELLRRITTFDSDFTTIRGRALVKANWTAEEYARAKTDMVGYDYSIEIGTGDLLALRDLLVRERSFLLSLLENQNLLEHAAFTELLWATFHLAEELEHRTDLTGLTRTDQAHVAGDIKRVYGLLLTQWLDHMRHLQTQYPYLFSLAVRINPLDPAAHAEVTE